MSANAEARIRPDCGRLRRVFSFCSARRGSNSGSAARKALKPAGDLVTRAADADGFKGKNGSTLDIVAPSGLRCRAHRRGRRSGKAGDLKAQGFREARRHRDGAGFRRSREAPQRSSPTCRAATVKPERAADLALGVRLRAYAFDRYKTKRKDDERSRRSIKVTIAVTAVARRKKAFDRVRRGGGRRAARARSRQRAANVLYPGRIRPPRRRA